MYKFSDLDHRITVQRVSVAASLYNEQIESWSTIATIWAKRIDASAGETIRAAAVEGKISAHFVVRYSTVTATLSIQDRIILANGPTYYNITGIRELERNRWLEIHCAAVQT